MATRLAPAISPDTEFFWNGLRDHKLLIQRCKGCGSGAQSTATDVPEMPFAGVGSDRVVGSRHRLQLCDAAPAAVPVLRLSLHRRVDTAGRRCPDRVEPDRYRPGRCPGRDAGRGLLPRVRRRILCCTSSGRPPDMDFTFTEEQETISKLARDVLERRATPERLTELEAGVSRYDAALWKELAGRRLVGHRAAGVVGRQRWWFRRARRAAGRSRRDRRAGARLCDAAAGRRPDRPARQSRATAALSARRRRRNPDPVRGSTRARPLRPDETGHHRPSRRRDVAAKRRQRAGVVRSARRYPADPRCTIDDGEVGLFLLPDRRRRASRSGRCRPPTASRTPMYSSTAQPLQGQTSSTATDSSSRCTPAPWSGCARSRSA